jgi:hypothetical protein
MSMTKQSGPGDEIVVVERGGRYFLRAPELNLIVDDGDLAAGYAKLARARQDTLEKYALLGVEPSRHRATPPAGLTRSVLSFCVKCAAVAATGSVLIIAGAVAVNYVTKEPLRDAAQKIGRAAVDQVIAGLTKVAHDDIPGDREARLRASLRAVVPVLKPYVQELRPLLIDDATAAPAGAARGN